MHRIVGKLQFPQYDVATRTCKLSEFCRHGCRAEGITLSHRGYGAAVISFWHIVEEHPGGNRSAMPRERWWGGLE
jgi:hypothetical protein